MTSKQPQLPLDDVASANEQLMAQQTVTHAPQVTESETSNIDMTGNAGEATLLVSEFPPPPYYYRLAGMNGGLQPPPIPINAITRGTYRAAEVAARAREAERRQRMVELHRGNDAQSNEDKTDSILGGVTTEMNIDSNDPNEAVVSVFGEILEDPLLVEPLDHCDDPIVVRDEVKRLHQIVLRTFVRMVQDLVHRPLENKYVHCTFQLYVSFVTALISKN
jgi:hypothetical protein